MEASHLHAHFYGFKQPYPPILTLMHEFHERVARGIMPPQLMLLEHEPVITLTRTHQTRSLKTSEEAIRKAGIALHLADRGGDATFHGPGQLVGYPIIRVKDIESSIRGLERSIYEALQSLGLKNIFLEPGFTGIWLKERDSKKMQLKKLVAIGMGIKDGVSKHGFSLNISIDSRAYLEHIIPCGLKDRGVATLESAFSQESLPMPDYLAIVNALAQSIATIFSLTLWWPKEETLELHKGAFTHG